MRRILFFIISLIFVTLSTFLIRYFDNPALAQGTQKQGELNFPKVSITPEVKNLETATSGTQQVDWVFDNQGRCWNAWSAPSCGLQQHEGGVTVPSMRDLNQDGVEDITCSQGGTTNVTTITNTSNSTITINCERYICMACATGNGIHAQCDGATDPSSQRIVETVELTPGCVATCTMQGVYGTCLEQKTPPPVPTATTIPTQTPASPTAVATVQPSATNTPIPTVSQATTPAPTQTQTPRGTHLPVSIDYSSYNSTYNEYPPTYVYAMMNRSYSRQATERGIAGLAAVQGNVVKMIMVSEYNALEQILSNHSAEITAAGITWIGYNAERDGRTPESELTNIFSSNPSTNVINRMGRLADQYGLKLMLGPTTPMWNEYFNRQDTEEVAAAMFGDNCYLDGIAFQEQKQINRTNKSQRAQEVAQRTAFFRNAAQNCTQFESMVQIMSSWCTQNASWEECKGYYDLLKNLNGDSRINSLAIWASGEERNDLPEFIEFLRN